MSNVWLVLGTVSAFFAGLFLFFLIWIVANRASKINVYSLALGVAFWTYAGATLATLHAVSTGEWYGFAGMVLSLVIGLFFVEILNWFRMEVWTRIQLWIYKVQKAVGWVK